MVEFKILYLSLQVIYFWKLILGTENCSYHPLPSTVNMSGGTPVGGGGYMRQRHSQGYASSGDDLEDDACSRPTTLPPSLPKHRTWIDFVENFLWIASAVFIIYYGDRHSNFIYLLWHDDRIRR